MDPTRYDSYIKGCARRYSWSSAGQSPGSFFGDENGPSTSGFGQQPYTSQSGNFGSWLTTAPGYSQSAPSDNGYSSQLNPNSPVFIPRLHGTGPIPATVPRKHQHPIKAVNTMYKTKFCDKWQATGTCPYETRCQFAHGPHELRLPVMHHLYKTKPCRSFHRTGLCPFGDHCDFLHQESGGRSKTGSAVTRRDDGNFDFFADLDENEPLSGATLVDHDFNWSVGGSPISSLQSSRAPSPGIWSSSSSLSDDRAWDDFFLAEDKGEIKDRKQQERINLSSRLLDEFINSIVD